MTRDGSAPTQLRQLAGVDVLPRLLNAAELAASVERNYPRGLRGTGAAGSVLVDVSIDERGSVTDVAVLPAPQTDVRAIALSDRADEPVEPASDVSTTRFGAAAVASLDSGTSHLRNWMESQFRLLSE